ncbi:FAD-dependent monooxygenase [Halobacillus rhizosphaerae]|uniref:FAD-dependent monooxygenase n=1 Tax=Halobacillus rhizosphaerae TaxID=3064889 RepID=UPI00398ACC31
MGFDTDVLIIGAGPSGLMLANEFEKHQVDYQIIDQSLERSHYSKALVVHSRSMEMLDMLGLADKFTTRGLLIKNIELYYKKERILENDFSLLHDDTDHPYLCIFPQSDTEAILERNLPPTKVLRGNKLLSLHTTDNGTIASIEKEDGRITTIKGKYMAACDGAHSRVRKELNMNFKGKSEDVHVMLGDVKLNNLQEKNKLRLISSDAGMMFLAPFKNGYTRVIAIDYQKQDMDGEVDLVGLQESVNKISPDPLRISDPYWLSNFTASHRQVDHYFKDGVFFVGDAAHIHNPAGGQGMNVGIQDASNLAWKLAYVLKYQLSVNLLATYEEERKKVAEDVIKKTNRMIRGITLQSKLGISTRNFVLKRLSRSLIMKKMISKNMSQISVDYRFTDLSKFMPHTRRGRQAGDRVPNHHNEEFHLYEKLRAGKCLLLMNIEDDDPDIFCEKVLPAIEDFNERVGGIISPYFIVNAESWLPDKHRSFLIIDRNKEISHKLGLKKGEVIVIRPDAHVLTHLSRFRLKKLAACLQAQFG